MPVIPDTSVFSKLRGFSDYQRANDEFEMRKQLQQAQIGQANLQAQALALKAATPDYDEIGKGAFIKAATQGVESLTPVEKAALLAADAKAQTFGFNPATGAMEQKPSMLDRAGIQLGNIQHPQAVMNVAHPTRQPMTKPQQDAGILDVYGDNPAQPVTLSTDAPSEWDIEFQKQLKAAAGNPKLQQSIKTDFAKAKISMTEAEAKAAGFADRMLQSNPIVDKTKAAGMNVSERAKAAIPVLGNFIVSKDYQSFNQAQRDFINAQLRRESGAVISPAEFDNAEKQYFPVPGDDENTLMQKKANRDAAVSGMVRSAGASYKQPKQPQQPTGLSPKERAESIFNAKAAVKKGKSADAVRQKLIDAGINPSEAGL